jgi:allantoate deiminase
VGRIAAEESRRLRGYDGVTMAEAMRDVGLDPARIGEARRSDIETFVELHIEQGPYLEREDIPVGIVDRITGYRQYLVTLEGSANHAGTTPMDLRRDPMAGAAEVISGVIDTAHRMGRPCVTTVGRVNVAPNERAVIPRQVAFTVDARSPDPAQRELLLARHEALIHEVAQRRDLSVTLRVDSDRPPVACDPNVVAAIAAAAAEAGVPAIRMTSGAVHDTMQLAEIAKIAMIFVRSRGGISHSPDEFTSADDAAAGTEVLARTLHALAYRS